MLLYISNCNVIRERICYWIFKKVTRSEKEYVIRDFKFNLIKEKDFFKRDFTI